MYTQCIVYRVYYLYIDVDMGQRKTSCRTETVCTTFVTHATGHASNRLFTLSRILTQLKRHPCRPPTIQEDRNTCIH